MQIIHRYIIKEFFKYFFLVEIVVISLFVTIEYISRIGRFIQKGMPLLEGIEFVLLQVPFTFTMLMPVCCTLASIVVFGLMVKNNEILALKSGGVSVYYLMRPVILMGLILTLFYFVVSEYVTPASQTKVYNVKRHLRNKSVKTTKDNNIWMKKNRTILHIKFYNSKDKSISDLTIYYFNKAFQLVRRIDARHGVYKEGKWVLSDTIEMKPGNEEGMFVSDYKKERIYKGGLKPEDLKSVIKRPEEMSIQDMYKYVKKAESEGYDPSKYKVDLQGKVAFPFVCLLMCIMGAGIVLAGKRTQGLPVSITLGICVAFLYWFFHSFCISLGYGEMLPPFIAAWMANIVFLCMSGVVLLNAE